MDISNLNETEKALYNWFSQQPLKAVSSKEIREKAIVIWKEKIEDGPRVARKLWEYGLLERAGGKAPYWFDPNVDHVRERNVRQVALFRRTLKSVYAQLQALSEYAASPGVLPLETGRRLAKICSEAQVSIREIRD